MSKPTLKVTADFTKDFNETIKKFKNDLILVGIPEQDATRKPTDKGVTPQINNATLLAINTFGSPANNIPPRPSMAIGIRNAQVEIAALYKKATIDALSKGVAVLTPLYERIGIVASTSIKKAINSQEGIDPPSEATLDRRESRGFKGTKALIVTGQMRNAITYVVKEGK